MDFQHAKWVPTVCCTPFNTLMIQMEARHRGGCNYYILHTFQYYQWPIDGGPAQGGLQILYVAQMGLQVLYVAHLSILSVTYWWRPGTEGVPCSNPFIWSTASVQSVQLPSAICSTGQARPRIAIQSTNLAGTAISSTGQAFKQDYCAISSTDLPWRSLTVLLYWIDAPKISPRLLLVSTSFSPLVLILRYFPCNHLIFTTL